MQIIIAFIREFSRSFAFQIHQTLRSLVRRRPARKAAARRAGSNYLRTRMNANHS